MKSLSAIKRIFFSEFRFNFSNDPLYNREENFIKGFLTLASGPNS